MGILLPPAFGYDMFRHGRFHSQQAGAERGDLQVALPVGIVLDGLAPGFCRGLVSFAFFAYLLNPLCGSGEGSAGRDWLAGLHKTKGDVMSATAVGTERFGFHGEYCTIYLAPPAHLSVLCWGVMILPTNLWGNDVALFQAP